MSIFLQEDAIQALGKKFERAVYVDGSFSIKNFKFNIFISVL